MTESRRDIIEYRSKRSNETFKEALLLFQGGPFNAVVNRLYFAAYYTVSALLYKGEAFSKTHSGLKTLFHLNYIKTNRRSTEDAEIYKELFDNRQDGDD